MEPTDSGKESISHPVPSESQGKQDYFHYSMKFDLKLLGFLWVMTSRRKKQIFSTNFDFLQFQCNF